jgi:hypothetical protein
VQREAEAADEQHRVTQRGIKAALLKMALMCSSCSMSRPLPVSAAAPSELDLAPAAFAGNGPFVPITMMVVA